LRELAWRRELTLEETASLRTWLEQNPAAPTDIEFEVTLGKAIRALPAAAVPSNFTAQVMQAIEREARQPGETKTAWSGNWWQRWLPRMAVAGVICVVALAGWRQHQRTERARLAESIQRVTAIATAPVSSDRVSLEIWQNFDVIRRLNELTADDELLTVAQMR
jgi:anti-sigma factor RsiW